MKIALLGYGKMGKAIEQIALQRQHQIVLKVNTDNRAHLTVNDLHHADVAIEFTGPHSAVNNILFCMEAGVPVICGSTGWLQQLPEVLQAVEQHQGTFLYASNFSVGVNLFFNMNAYVAKLMAPHVEYTVSIEEIHHTQKKDAPSGTAITLAEGIMQYYTQFDTWVSAPSQQANELSIVSKRIDPAPGTHTVRYSSPIDTIEITHTAHSREGFASGAMLAAEFIQDRKGVFSMKDVLGL
ncbi:MAG: 4-hydroxy-tetrahydrodipicolinate reductase [Chitinophagaceae bacterium]